MVERITDTHKALKETSHPNIFFTLSKIQSVKANDDHLLIKATGDLNIAGVSKPINLDVKAFTMANGNIRFEGEKALKMTTFGIDPRL